LTFVPAFPRIDATIRENKTGELTINGTSHAVVAADLARLRAGVIAQCAATARKVKRPVRVTVVDVAGTYSIAIHPDAFVQVLDNTGHCADLPAGAARPISNSPCRRCGESVPVSAVTCPQCDVENPHDVRAAPPSTRVTAPITIPVPPARAEPTELLARWAPAAAAAPKPVVDDFDEIERTVIRAPQRQLTADLLFSTGQNLIVTTSALVGRSPAPQDGESVGTLFSIDDPTRTVSKTHFRIDWKDDALNIVDRHSGNGVVVERDSESPRTLAPMAAFELHEGDRVLIGDQAFTVTIRDAK
jgi:ribosomal protein L40E